MKVCTTLLLFIFILTAPQDGETSFFGPFRVINLTGTEGGTITFQCAFDFPEMMKTLQRGDGQILLETTGSRAQRGRYRMEYDEAERAYSSMTLHVSITELKKDDSGRYSCVFDEGRRPSLTQEFELRVEDAPSTSAPETTPLSLTHPDPTTSKLIQIPQAFPSAPPASRENIRPPTPPAPFPDLDIGLQLYVRLVLFTVTIVSSASLLIVCWGRIRGDKEPDAELDYLNISSGCEECEEVREEIVD
ncbi:uncharacterized protein LOC121517835 [Cheilinus undulatus]|uniref:uncharacterized protein LOC121517835 n=1 Tax=Cheilinus undulatus TaxID=241271 RepID=UPI001BD32008|nr:uncharacterized protein LOC121517835 [Cheilinus undulatus]